MAELDKALGNNPLPVQLNVNIGTTCLYWKLANLLVLNYWKLRLLLLSVYMKNYWVKK